MTAFVNSRASLPVALVSFTATPVYENVRLEWVISREMNNRGFEVQRSRDGTTFQHIGFVEGPGTSQGNLNYAFLDRPALEGTVYYRLRQVDFDGNASAYSRVVSVTLGVAGQSVALYPNPARSHATLRWSAGAGGEVAITLTNSRGQAVYTEWLDEAAQNAHRLNLERYAPGLYLLTLRREGSIVSQTKVLKQ